jgi:preprotein translocase subunit SecE
VSDDPDRPGSDDDGSGAVVTRPTRPTGKRSRRGAVGEDVSEAVDLDTGGKAAPTKNGSGSAKKTAKKGADHPSRNPFAFVWNYLKQVVAELRKVIWPNRKQMITYTTVVMLFLVFMVVLISLTDLGLTKVVMMIFGDG